MVIYDLLAMRDSVRKASTKSLVKASVAVRFKQRACISLAWVIGRCCCAAIAFRVCPYKPKRDHSTVIQNISIKITYKIKAFHKCRKGD